MTTCLSDAQLCSLVSKNSGEQPLGSASVYQALLVLELPPPWPRNALHAPQLAPEVRDVMAAFGRSEGACSVLAVAPDPVSSRPGAVRALYFRRPDGPFADFERQGYLIPQTRLAAFLDALLLQQDVSAFAPYLEAHQGDLHPRRDLLVCTHANRDICCGRFGEAAYQALRFVHERPGVRVWRTSHIGGHKFAPTLIDLPSGRFWGHLEPHAYQGVVDNSLEPGELKRFYRGWSGVGKLEQHAEGAAFEREGWGWTRVRKTARIVSAVPERDEVTVQLAFVRQDGTRGIYEAVVACAGTAETLASSGDAPRVTVKQYEVTRLKLL